VQTREKLANSTVPPLFKNIFSQFQSFQNWLKSKKPFYEQCNQQHNHRGNGQQKMPKSNYF
jgi:hypothetical protein